MRRRWLSWLGLAVGCLVSPSAANAQSAANAPRQVAGAPASELRGRLKLLTYNVAGLPEGMSRSRPVANLPVIGKLLNAYDLTLVQEDFAYPDRLRQSIALAYGSPPFVRGGQLHFGDGLSQFSRSPFVDYQREPWATCHGILDSFFDCLTPKGFTYSRQQLAPGVFVDVYNLHMDAGWSPGDRNARAAQLAQLAAAIQRRSTGSAVLVGGDFNIGSAELDVLAKFESDTGLKDTCSALRCREPWRIDRVLFRSSPELRLAPRSWRIDRRFVDRARRPLSDHLAVAVELDWVASRQLSAEAGNPATPPRQRSL